MAVRRIRGGYPLSECVAEEVDEKVRHAAHEITGTTTATGRQAAVGPEVSWLKVHIAARGTGNCPQRH